MEYISAFSETIFLNAQIPTSWLTVLCVVYDSLLYLKFKAAEMLNLGIKLLGLLFK